MADELVVAILQARTSSSRLPGKVLMPLLGKPMLARQVERILRAGRIDRIAIATSTRSDDNPIEELAAAIGVPCVRGALDDVLDRYMQAANQTKATQIVRLTGDCPLIDPDVIDAVVDRHLLERNDYTSNVVKRSYPDGLDVEVLTRETLEATWRDARTPFEKEHVTPFIYRNPDRFKIGHLRQMADESYLNFCVDTADDMVRVRKIYDALYQERPDFRLADIRELLSRRGDIDAVRQGSTSAKAGMPQIPGTRIYLRALGPEDATGKYVAWLCDPAVNRFLETRYSPQSIESIREFVTAVNARENEHLFGIFLRDGDRHIGNIKVGPIRERYGTADVSLFIGEREVWGKGYASEAIGAISSFAFEQLRLRKLNAGIYAPNVGSMKAFIKAGWKQEGLRRKQFLHDGTPCDEIVMGALPEDLRQRDTVAK